MADEQRIMQVLLNL